MSYSLKLPCWSIGADCYKDIYHFCRVYGTKAAVIGGHTALDKAYGAIKEALAGTDLEISEPIWYGGNATYENSYKLMEMEEVKNADMIFAVGGGRAVDTCKTAADLMHKPLFTFPTLGSNCAGCTAIAIMYYESGVFKDIHYGEQCPVHCFMNSAVIADSPVDMLWAGIGDSIAKEFESSLAAREKELSHVPTMGTTIAHACTGPLMKYGPGAMESIKKKEVSNDLEECVLAIVITAGLVSNMTISTDGGESFFFNASAAHAFYYAATVVPECAEHHLHGELVCLGIQVLFALDHQYDKLKWFQEWAHGMGFPVTMDEVSLKPEDLPACAAKAADGSVAEWGRWPYEVTQQDFVDAILEMDKYGKAYLASLK